MFYAPYDAHLKEGNLIMLEFLYPTIRLDDGYKNCFFFAYDHSLSQIVF